MVPLSKFFVVFFIYLTSSQVFSAGPFKGPAGYGDAFPGTRYKHLALDFMTNFGEAALATGDGVVVEAHEVDTRDELPVGHRMQPYGKYVEIKHGSFFSGFISRYGHLDTLSVKKGDIVKRGQVIGTIGTTGTQGPMRNIPVFIPHVHLEFFRGADNRFNPMEYVVGCFNANTTYTEEQHTYPVNCVE